MFWYGAFSAGYCFCGPLAAAVLRNVVERPIGMLLFHKKAASSMALEWCSRMQYFHDIYTAQDDPDFLYTQAELDSYEESLEFVEFMLAIPDDHVLTLERCRKLRRMRPVNPN